VAGLGRGPAGRVRDRAAGRGPPPPHRGAGRACEGAGRTRAPARRGEPRRGRLRAAAHDPGHARSVVDRERLPDADDEGAAQSHRRGGAAAGRALVRRRPEGAVGMTVAAARHGGDRVADVLQAHGVPCVYTLCGGHISPILSAAKARGIRIVDVRDEATAVFAADAAARLSGLPGVAAVTAGPGITNTITALKNAQLAQSPLVLLGGAAPTALQGRGALQDIDQRPLVEPHVKRFFKLRRVRDLGPAVEEAFALARSAVPGPVFVECPVDLLYDEASIRQWYADAGGKGTSLPDR